MCLEGFRPILPDLPYADWLLVTREKLQTAYLDNCLIVGQAQLAGGDFPAAQHWAQCILAIAPWMEIAHQLLMRSFARQGLRSSALRAYAEAETALQQELAVQPAPLTKWLYTCIQSGQSI